MTVARVPSRVLGGAFDHALQGLGRLVPHHHAELVDDRAFGRLAAEDARPAMATTTSSTGAIENRV